MDDFVRSMAIESWTLYAVGMILIASRMHVTHTHPHPADQESRSALSGYRALVSPGCLLLTHRQLQVLTADQIRWDKEPPDRRLVDGRRGGMCPGQPTSPSQLIRSVIRRRWLSTGLLTNNALAHLQFFYTGFIVSVNEVAKNGSNYMAPEVAAALSPEEAAQAEYGSKMTLVLEMCTLTTVWLVKACLLFLYFRLT